MRPLDFLRLARRFYSSHGWRDSCEGAIPPAIAVAFRTAYGLVPESWRSLAWRTYGACGPREAPRARWSRAFDARAEQRRKAAAEPAGTWNRAFHLKLARAWWFERDARDSDPAPFRLP